MERKYNCGPKKPFVVLILCTCSKLLKGAACKDLLLRKYCAHFLFFCAFGSCPVRIFEHMQLAGITWCGFLYSFSFKNCAGRRKKKIDQHVGRESKTFRVQQSFSLLCNVVVDHLFLSQILKVFSQPKPFNSGMGFVWFSIALVVEPSSMDIENVT